MMSGRSQRHLREIYGMDSGGNTSGSQNDPVAVNAPTITGTAQVGQTLTRTHGTFTGKDTVTVSGQWLKGTTPIDGATGATYVPVAGDVGSVIRFRSIGTNQWGATNNDSDPTAAVIAA